MPRRGMTVVLQFLCVKERCDESLRRLGKAGAAEAAKDVASAIGKGRHVAVALLYRDRASHSVSNMN
jgi:hypothetical protein